MRRVVAITALVAGLAGLSAPVAPARTLHFPVTVTVSGSGHVREIGDGGSIDCQDAAGNQSKTSCAPLQIS